jgi:hypothetical protein
MAWLATQQLPESFVLEPFPSNFANPRYILIKKATHLLLVCGFLVSKLTNQITDLISSFQKNRPSWCDSAR